MEEIIREKKFFIGESNRNSLKIFNKMNLIIIIILIILFFELKKNISILNYKENKIRERTTKNFDINFDYYNYQREKINEKLIKKERNDSIYYPIYLLNGIIRKLKPKKCLEIGKVREGTTFTIINALKDIKDSILISLDTFSQNNQDKEINMINRVKTYFPEFINKWKIYTRMQPHKLLDNLNIKFDLLYLDTEHSTPIEYLYIIETFPFLNNEAIIVIHNLMFHQLNSSHHNYQPSNIFLLTSLYGDKIIKKDEKYGIENN